MSLAFEELDYRPTPIGALSLRRRREPGRDDVLYEIKLGDEFLMSSRFTAAEIALARLGLAELRGGDFEVVVGGLGLGYTARAALEDQRLASLLVVEALGPVVEWHRQGLLPLGAALTSDPRCRFVEGDFFALAGDPEAGFDPTAPGRRFHAVLLDIDHAPDQPLDPANSAFYGAAGLERLARQLHPGGVFALWSNDPPDPAFLATLRQVFAEARAEVVSFPNPIQGGESANTVYLASRPA
ncbi:Spermidine synthase [Tistlia consotensis]|uniref:Spermidine synthase n=1 Tax=Tistlia consotensis USBA 355 TaxID=560819 RepID=A0A1Y6C7V0_9PROT|nr:spermidine synthase [Tistlia consotensis]SMF40677.1 Spermidine synthase [Tistlia consotensis USBA 355]SNR74607.1 Spermidine synthase [Tistlia consotensis]